MASSGEYLDYVLDLLSDLEDISHRKMMGEYVLYYRGKVFGGIYDDRFLIKPTSAAIQLLPDAPMAVPYPGAKEMVQIDTEDRQLLKQVVMDMYAELPEPKRKKKRS